jgi:hypothetical protein
LDEQFAVILLIYFILNTAYSLYLKQLTIIDVLIIASCFILRLMAGFMLINISPDKWLVMLTLFFKPEVVDKILAVVAMWQPVILALIGKMAVQNVAGIKASAQIEDAKIYAKSEEKQAVISAETPKPC